MTADQMKKLLASNIFLLSSQMGEDDDPAEFYGREMECGANVLLAPDFPVLTGDVSLVEATVDAAGETAFSACRIPAPQGGLTLNGGAYSYRDYYRAVLKQAERAENAGVSFLILGGFRNLIEAKCAVYAAKEATELPICVGLCFDEDILLEHKIDASKAIITLQVLGVNAVGVIASDADDTLEALSQMKEFSSLPLFALPSVSEFMAPEDFADYATDYVNDKCAMIGAIGGKASDTAAVSKVLWQTEPFRPDFHTVDAVTGLSDIIFYDFKGQIIGGRKRLLEITIEKEEEVEPLIKRLIASDTPPVCFCCKDMDALELAIKLYPGRPAVRSDEYGEIAAKEYGALILSEGGKKDVRTADRKAD